MLAKFTTLTLRDASNTRSLTLNQSDMIHQESDGFGIPPLMRLSESHPLQHGSIDRGFRLQARRLRFRLALRSGSPLQFYERRQTLIDLLRPAWNGQSAVLSLTLPDESTWMLNVYCQELRFEPPQALIQIAEFTLNAPDPVWKADQPTTLHTFSSADLDTAQVIIYPGAWVAYPYPLSLRGPLQHPILYNLSADSKLDLDYSIPAGQTVQFDLRPEHKTILCGETSLLPALSTDSDLETFCLLPAPDLAHGHNLLQISGSAATQQTLITLGYIPTRLGV